MIGAAAAWILDHQIGSDSTLFDCTAGSAVTIGVGILALVLAAASGFASYRLWRSDLETHARRFVALLGAMMAVLLAIAIALSTVAGFILPGCLA